GTDRYSQPRRRPGRRQRRRFARSKSRAACIELPRVSGASLWNRLREKQGTRGVNANNLGVVQASHSLGVAGNFQPNSFTAITASVRLVTFSALRIAVT